MADYYDYHYPYYPYYPHYPSSSSSSSGGYSERPSRRRSRSASSDQSLSNLNLTEAQATKYREQYNAIDTDGDGTIDAEELFALAVMLNSADSAPDVEAMLAAADINEDGLISFYEFCSILKTAEDHKYRVIYELFKHLDADDSGHISDKELRDLLRRMGRKFATSGSSKIGMIDQAQLEAKGINPSYISMALADEDRAKQKRLLDALDDSERGKMTLEQFARQLGHLGECDSLSSISLSYSSSSYSSSGSGSGSGSGSASSSDSSGKVNVIVSEFFTGRIHKISINRSNNFDKLRKVVSKKNGVDVSLIKLYYRGFEVRNGRRTLLESRVKMGETVYAVIRPNARPLDSSLFWESSNVPHPWNIFTAFQYEQVVARHDLELLCSLAVRRFKREPVMVEVDGPVTVVGDLHGQFFDLRNVFTAGGVPGQQKYLFLGDYVDRGYFSAEVLVWAIAAAVAWPGKFYMLRGNHESLSQNKKASNGFITEFEHKYGSGSYDAVLAVMVELPVCALVTHAGKRFFCAHGGIHSKIADLANDMPSSKPDENLKGDAKHLMWNDPDDDCFDHGKKGRKRFLKDSNKGKTWRLSQLETKTDKPSSSDWKRGWKKNRGRGGDILKYRMGAVAYFCHKNNVTAIIRGHEQKNGFEWGRDGLYEGMPGVFTVFSAPNYTDKNMAHGGVAVFSGNDKMTLKPYGWNLHPIYYANTHQTRPYERHYLMEDYMLYLAHFYPDILKSVSLVHLRSQVAVRKFLRDINRRFGEAWVIADLDTDTTDWAFLQENMTEALNMSGSKRLRALYRQRTSSEERSLWYSTFDWFADSLLREAEMELEEEPRFSLTRDE